MMALLFIIIMLYEHITTEEVKTMGFSNIGGGGFLVLLLLALLIFGPQKLPELGRSFGQTIKEFKQSSNEFFKDDKQS